MYYFAALNTSVPQSAKAKSWPCDELNGFILVWYHAEQEEPNWKAPLIPEIAAKKWTYGGRNRTLRLFTWSIYVVRI
jgi:phenylpropionate dioxygenase-like ring-hydroxylating dioxygenase large terminal subunit